MPLARIDMIKGQSRTYRQTVGDVVYQAMVDLLKAPKDDRFQIITEHDEDNFIFDPHFLGSSGQRLVSSFNCFCARAAPSSRTSTKKSPKT